MSKQNNNDYDIVDKGSKLEKIDKNTSSFIGNIVDKIGDFPNFAKEILKSSDKSEENYKEFAKKDKEIIEMIIKHKLESGNYTDEELKEWYDKTQKVTENQGFVLDKMSKHKKELLVVVGASLLFTLNKMLEHKNKS